MEAEDTTIDEPAGTFCPRCIQRSPATLRAAWAAAGVALMLIVSAIPIAIAGCAHVGPAFLRSPEGVLGAMLSGIILGVSAALGAMACFTEARK